MIRLTDKQMAEATSSIQNFKAPLDLIEQQKISDTEFPRDAWDDGVYYSSIVQDAGGTYRMMYTAYPSATKSGPAIATSTDLITWTKPNIGDVVHEVADGGDGTANNNLIIIMNDTEGTEGVDLSFYDGLYIALLKDNTPTEHNTKLYTSVDGENFSYLSTPLTVADHGTSLEAKSLLKIDGVYRIYCRSGSGQTRSIGYYESATLTGTIGDGSWVWSGLLLEAPDQDNQYYDFQTWEYAGQVWGCCPRYNKTTEILGPLELYGSADGGMTFNYQGVLLALGETGTWNDELLAVGRPMLINGTWKLVYSASSEGHDTWIRPMSFGIATV